MAWLVAESSPSELAVINTTLFVFLAVSWLRSTIENSDFGIVAEEL